MGHHEIPKDNECPEGAVELFCVGLWNGEMTSAFYTETARTYKAATRREVTHHTVIRKTEMEKLGVALTAREAAWLYAKAKRASVVAELRRFRWALEKFEKACELAKEHGADVPDSPVPFVQVVLQRADEPYEHFVELERAIDGSGFNLERIGGHDTGYEADGFRRLRIPTIFLDDKTQEQPS